MKQEYTKLLSEVLKQMANTDHIQLNDIPNIDLYMDQVTTFMDTHLSASKRFGEDKILTKTMINNYAKNDLLPPPVKKKYSKEHVLLLIFIYYYKGILSISDIQTLLKPVTEKFFQSDRDFDLEDIYLEVFSMEEKQIQALKEDVVRKFRVAQGTFQEAPEEDADFLRRFAFICTLSFDVYVKKLMIEKMIDDLSRRQSASSEGRADEKKKNHKSEKNNPDGE